MTEPKAASEETPEGTRSTEPLQLRRSALADMAEEIAAAEVTGERAVKMREIPFATQMGIRVNPGTAAAKTIEDFWKISLPASVGDTTGDPQGASVIWLSPDEFLYVDVSRFREHGEAHRVQQLLGESPGQIVDLSANRTIVELSGPQVRGVLEKSCHIDLHPREFPVSTAVSTLVGSVQMILHRSGEDSFRLYPRASFAHYVARWLMDSMAEFTSPLSTG